MEVVASCDPYLCVLILLTLLKNMILLNLIPALLLTFTAVVKLSPLVYSSAKQHWHCHNNRIIRVVLMISIHPELGMIIPRYSVV